MGAEVLAGVALGILLVAPSFLPPYFLEILISVMLFGYLGAAWNILGGYAGQFSFGHAAYFGIGAYTSTLLFLKLGVTPWLGMLAGGVLAALFGLFAGYLSFRYGLRGPYFSLVTLAFAEMLRVVAVNTKAVGSSLGLVIPNREPAPVNFVFAGKLSYYYVILAMAVGAVWITRRTRSGSQCLPGSSPPRASAASRWAAGSATSPASTGCRSTACSRPRSCSPAGRS